MSHSDVSSAHATATGAMVSYRARVKNIAVTTTATAGTVVLRDGGASGDVKMTLTTPAAVGLYDITVPDAGVLFESNVHATLTNVTAVTLFHG